MRYVATSQLRRPIMRHRFLGKAKQECEHAAPPPGCKWVSDGTQCGANLVCPDAAPAPLPPAVVPIISYPSTPQNGVLTQQQQMFYGYYQAWQSYLSQNPPGSARYLSFNDYLTAAQNAIATGTPIGSPPAATVVTSTLSDTVNSALSNIPLWGWALGAGALVYAFSGKKGRW